MPRNCFTVEQIITKLREAEVALSKGQPVVQVPWPSGSPNKPTIAGNSGIGSSSLKRSMSVFVSAGSTALRKAKPTATTPSTPPQASPAAKKSPFRPSARTGTSAPVET